MKWHAEDEFDPDEEEDAVDAEDDREAPDASDIDDSDDEETVPCPYCKKPVYEHADLCPHCRSFLSFADAPPSRAWWYWAAAILALIGAGWWEIWWLVGVVTHTR